MNPHYADVALRAGHRCEYCHAPEAVFNFPFEVEHIVPVSRGGSDVETNWALACRSCTLHKSAHTVAVDPETGAEADLFPPRRDRWEEHFRVDVPGGKIEGLTPMGRATVGLLNVNSRPQVLARRQWIRLGVFP